LKRKPGREDVGDNVEGASVLSDKRLSEADSQLSQKIILERSPRRDMGGTDKELGAAVRAIQE
jgi:hypothetical protein